MARIPDEVIERLKGEVALVRLVETAGVTLKRHGADLLGLCPFHDDHEPSLVVTPAVSTRRASATSFFNRSMTSSGILAIKRPPSKNLSRG